MLSEILDPRFGTLQRMIEEIDAGGPLTVSHPSTFRRYTSVKHAVELVIEGWVQGRGRICLAYGRRPHRELDVALALLARRGLRADADIVIDYRLPADFEIQKVFAGSDALTYPAFVAIDGPEPDELGKLAGSVEERARVV